MRYITSFRIDNRLRQMALFALAKVGKGRAKAGFCVMLKCFGIKKGFISSSLFCHYIKQIEKKENTILTSVLAPSLHQQFLLVILWFYRVLVSAQSTSVLLPMPFSDWLRYSVSIRL